MALIEELGIDQVSPNTPLNSVLYDGKAISRNRTSR